MAEAELTIQYKSKEAAIVKATCWVAWPISTLLWLWALIVLIYHSAALNMASIIIFMFVNALLVSAIGLTLFLSSDQTIFITRDGLSLPIYLSPAFGLRAKKKWKDLLSINFDHVNSSGKLILNFKNSRPISLNLRHLHKEHLDSLVMALDVWAGGSENFSALLEARTFVYQQEGGLLPEHTHGYTEMWQDELARRFGSTTFVPLEPGDILESQGLKVEKQIAFGGLSAIYLVRDKGNERFVLKEAVVPDDTDERLKEQSHSQLKREAEMLARLSHDQIARVFDHFVARDRHYLVLEYLPGSDLRRLIKEAGPQSETMVVDWGMQMAQMLSYLHGQSEPILHRDFTPDNMILKNDGTVAIIDFGAANFFLGTATGTMIGKQAYIAPEQLRGKATQRSDLYALGGSLFFLLTGEDPEPLSPSSPRAVNAAISSGLDALILKLTAMEEEDRIMSADLALVALKDIKAGYATPLQA